MLKLLEIRTIIKNRPIFPLAMVLSFAAVTTRISSSAPTASSGRETQEHSSKCRTRCRTSERKSRREIIIENNSRLFCQGSSRSWKLIPRRWCDSGTRGRNCNTIISTEWKKVSPKSYADALARDFFKPLIGTNLKILQTRYFTLIHQTLVRFVIISRFQTPSTLVTTATTALPATAITAWPAPPTRTSSTTTSSTPLQTSTGLTQPRSISGRSHRLDLSRGCTRNWIFITRDDGPTTKYMYQSA